MLIIIKLQCKFTPEPQVSVSNKKRGFSKKQGIGNN